MPTWNAALRLVQIFIRWWLLIVFAEVQSGAVAAYLVANQPQQYVAQTTLMVGGNLQSPKPSENIVGISLTLASFYAEMARRTPITAQVVDQLKLPFSPDILNTKMVSARVVPQAQLIEISVLDTDPRRAAAIANSVATALIKFSPTSPEKTQLQRQFTQGQINDLANSIRQTDSQIAEATDAIQRMTSAGEIAEAQQRVRELQLTKTNAQDVYSGLLTTLNDSAVNSLTVFEAASPPTEALPRRLFPIVLVASMLGCLLGLAVAYLLDGFDDAWRRGRQPEIILGEPTLVSITMGSTEPFTRQSLDNARGRAIQGLRSEVLMRLAGSAQPTLMITSAHASHLRTGIATDLARLFAWSGQPTLLVDANLGEGVLTESFGLTGNGTQHLLRHPDSAIATLIQPTVEPNLHVLPGETAGAMSHVVPVQHWSRFVAAAQNASDVVIFDGPAALDRPDALLLSPHVGGVVLVIDPTSESCSETKQAVARLREIDAPLLGTVFIVPHKRGFMRFRRSALAAVTARQANDTYGIPQ